jgi:hypothetical protein
MEKQEKLQALNTLFADVSKKLSAELSSPLPDAILLKECRKQLGQIDKDIRRIQVRKDMDF